jgi:drug/metabolite transporter (DMT)-like permease
MSSLPNKRLLLATVIGAVGICLWATETVLVTFTTGLPTLEIVALAFAVASSLSPLVWKITGGSPLDGFRQPISVWLMTVPCLVLYHACIYYAVHRVPATPAALLHGATPLFIVLGSALLPGEHIRWWHLAGAGLGAVGMVWLVDGGSSDLAVDAEAAFYLACIGLAAGLWGVYSLCSRRFGDVPTSVMGTFYAAAALLAGIGHLTFETWVTPSNGQIGAIVALGLLPMGLALYCWDYGVKRGDIQALGAASYVEPLIGAFLVVALGQGQLLWSMVLAGMLIVGGSILAAGSLWRFKPRGEIDAANLNDSPQQLAAQGRESLHDLLILFRCQTIINHRINFLLRSALNPPTDNELSDASKDHLMFPQIDDLRRSASEALTMYSYILDLLDHMKHGEASAFRRAYTKGTTLSAQEFNSLTQLAIQAIVQLNSPGEAVDVQAEPVLKRARRSAEEQAA